MYYRSEKGFRFTENLIKLHAFTRKVIRDRKAEILNNSSSIVFKTSDGEDRRKAFLDLLLDHHINGGEMSEEDIREEVDTFMFEGINTFSQYMSTKNISINLSFILMSMFQIIIDVTNRSIK